jgi:hypothetical protein
VKRSGESTLVIIFGSSPKEAEITSPKATGVNTGLIQRRSCDPQQPAKLFPDFSYSFGDEPHFKQADQPAIHTPHEPP